MEAFAGATVVAGGGGVAARLLLLPRRAPPLLAGAGRARLVQAPRAAPAPAAGDGGGSGGGLWPKLDKWDKMELEFGRFLGEDPKLTLAKILTRKLDPDASYLDVEKLVENKKDKLNDILKDLVVACKQALTSRPLEGKRPVMNKPMQDKHAQTSRLLEVKRPVMDKPVQDKHSLSLSRPVMRKQIENKKSSSSLSQPLVTLTDMLKDLLAASKLDQTSKSLEGKPSLNLTRPIMNKPMQDKHSLSLSQPVMGKPIEDKSSWSLSQLLESESKEEIHPLTLSRPVGSKLEKHKHSLTLSRPVGSNRMQDSWSSKKSLAAGVKASQLGSTSSKSSADVALRKPTVGRSRDDELTSKLKMKPNIVLKTKKDLEGSLSNISLQKPQAVNYSAKSSQEYVSAGSPSVAGEEDRNEANGRYKSRLQSGKINGMFSNGATENYSKASLDETSVINSNFARKSSKLPELQPAEQSFTQDMVTSASPVDNSLVNSISNTKQALLQGKPDRMDSSVGGLSNQVAVGTIGSSDNDGSYTDDLERVLSSKLEDIDESDWARLEHYASTGEKVEVELIDCSLQGFVVSLDSVVGLLPYRKLAARWRFLAFETWLRRKGVDPSLHRQNLGIVESLEVNNNTIEPGSGKASEVAHLDKGSSLSSMKFDDLLGTYEKEKSKFLSSFIGRRLRVSVALADRNSRQILFSMMTKKTEDYIEKKRSLMAKLSIGDIVKCRIKKFEYFGIFVEVEGVPALIHQEEVSWEDTLDPSISFKVGQVLDAKVTQLDYTTERISLSLKDVKPDTSPGASGSVFDEASLGGALEAAQADLEWPEVESLIQEMQKIEEVGHVYKGRFFLSPGLAPTFQVYMAPLVGNKYKLLARYGNYVQEVMVEASLDQEQMKAAILTCTKRVS